MNNTNNIDTLLKVAVKDIKTAILQSQYRAAKVVNREQLSLYFGIGKYVSENSRKRFWGTGAIESISLQLQKELPGLRGFGARNLKNMRVFYEEWASYLNSAATAAELPVVSNQPPRTNDLDIVDFNLLTLSRGCVKMQILTRTQRCVRMVKMQGAEDEGAGSVLKYMTKPEDDSNAA
ncbi:MAG: DUF1016 N-terminal domain-containing protein, partial [Bacteroidales bacterium]|nr:DUF1016 N-terminal domain-containing protein [Bacteroidales bacterium]